jgi:hypothetical protein
MMDQTDETVQPFQADASWRERVDGGITEAIADALEDEAARMRGENFRSGKVGIEYINGFEGAAAFVRTWSAS